MKKIIAVYIDLENVAGILDLDVMIQDIIRRKQRGFGRLCFRC